MSEDKVRVFEYAKKIGKQSNELIEFLNQEGFEIKNHMAVLGPYEIRRIKEHFDIHDEAEEEVKPTVRIRRRVSQTETPTADVVAEPAQEVTAVVVETKEKASEHPVHTEPKIEVKHRHEEDDSDTVGIDIQHMTLQEIGKQTTTVQTAEVVDIPVVPSIPEVAEVKKNEPVIVLSEEEQRKKEKLDAEEYARKNKGKKKVTKDEKLADWKNSISFWEEEEDADVKKRKQAKKDQHDSKKEDKKAVTWAELVKRNAVKTPAGKSEKKQKEETVEKLYLMKGITCKDFAETLGIAPEKLIQILAKEGVEVESLENAIEEDYAHLIADEFKKELTIIKSYGDDILIKEYEQFARDDIKNRPPVVTIMGHVDHGKTSILDYIRKSRVTAKEFGGITQHIGAYSVTTAKGAITFVDTPGHQAFSAMRARGANLTDIVVLVVAADDGVMPQTVEAINHAKAAGVPIVVAVNKMDLATAKPDKVRQELTQYSIISEDWGGQNLFVNCSAYTGDGIDELLDMILLQAEMLDLKAVQTAPARGIVVEARVEKGKGTVATILVKEGTLRSGDIFLVGNTWGKVRMMTDDLGKLVKETPPGHAVEITGIEEVPMAGDEFAVLKNEKRAKYIAEKRAYYAKRLGQPDKKEAIVSLEDLFAKLNDQDAVTLPFIVKGDTQGTLEAIEQAISGIHNDQVALNIIHSGIGMVAETDINLAITAKAIVVAFNVRVDAAARKMAEDRRVEIRSYNIIYKLIEDVQKAVDGMLKPEEEEVYQGSAEVRQVIRIPDMGNIAGSYILDGKIMRHAIARLMRNNGLIWQGHVGSIFRFKDSVKEVSAGYECGIGLDGFADFREGDIIEVFQMEEKKS